jgi:hypothetical protein
LGLVLCCSQSGDDLLLEDLAKLGYKINTKVEFLNNFFYIFGDLLFEPYVETVFFCYRRNFVQKKKLKKELILQVFSRQADVRKGKNRKNRPFFVYLVFNV